MLRFHDNRAGGPTSTSHMLRTLLATALAITAIVAAPATDTSAADDTPALDDTPWQLPETPQRCTTAQADSGDVGDCLLAFYHDPSTTGWGAPPAPGVGPGWDWQGHTYRGSPALVDWEKTYIRSNVAAVAWLVPANCDS